MSYKVIGMICFMWLGLSLYGMEKEPVLKAAMLEDDFGVLNELFAKIALVENAIEHFLSQGITSNISHRNSLAVDSAYLSPQCNYIIAQSAGPVVEVFDIRKFPVVVPCITCHEGAAKSIAISQDDKYMLKGYQTGIAELSFLENSTGKPYELFGHTDAITSVAFSKDRSYVLTGSRDGTARIWDIKALEAVKSYVLTGHTKGITSVATSPSSDKVLTGSWDKTARIWDISNPESVTSYELKGHKEDIQWVQFSPTGTYAITRDKTEAYLWNISDLKSITSHRIGDRRAVSAIVFSPDEKYLLIGYFEGAAQMLDIPTLKGTAVSYTLKGFTNLCSGAFSPTGLHMLLGSADGSVKLCTITGTDIVEKTKLDGHNGWVSSVVWSVNGRYILTASWDGTLVLRDMTSLCTATELASKRKQI